jgi:hypothetical protein
MHCKTQYDIAVFPSERDVNFDSEVCVTEYFDLSSRTVTEVTVVGTENFFPSSSPLTEFVKWSLCVFVIYLHLSHTDIGKR